MEQVLDKSQAMQEASVCMAICHPSVVGPATALTCTKDFNAQAVTPMVKWAKKLSEQSLGDAFTCLGAAGPAAAFNSSATLTVFLSAVLMEQVSACSLQFSGQYHHKLDSAVTSHDGANSYQTFGQTYLLWLFG